MTPRTVVILGSTGSIGTQALDVIRANPGRFQVTGLAAGGGDTGLLARQMAETGCEIAAVAAPGAAPRLREAYRSLTGGRSPLVRQGDEGIEELLSAPCDIVLNGIAGAAGLRATLAALRSGRTVALANKESLVAGGPLVSRLAGEGRLIPVDSEHSAIAQCLRGGRADEVRRLVLTASGGPFRGRTRAELADVTPEQALAHPTWSMGPLVSVNSATLVNKGLEVIEAHELFGIPYDRIGVVVHPQSAVHSMVEFTDGSTLAQASPPDMRLPIALALAWPGRVADAAPPIDWSRAHAWEFEPLDEDVFPAVRLARAAGEAGGTAPAVFTAANEECVAAFLAGRLRFPALVDTVAAVLGEPGAAAPAETVDDVLAADAWARARAAERVAAAGRRRVLLARPRGYCAGVDRAVRAVEAALDRYGPPVYVRRQIVHNVHVVKTLRERGAVFVDEAAEVPEGAVVVFSAHGVAPGVHTEAAERGLRTIDATCPLVTKVHKEAVRFAADGHDILLIGHADHEEVVGTTGEAPEHIRLVDGPEGVASVEVRDPGKVVWLSQTTLSVDETAATVRALRERFPALVDPPSDDICYATQNRQTAVRAIAPRAGLVIVVGSANSSNSVRLVEVALEHGARAAHLVDYAGQIDPAWLEGHDTVGVTSGASVPEELVQEVLERLARGGFGEVEEVEVVPEHMTFGLPRELRDPDPARKGDPA